MSLSSSPYRILNVRRVILDFLTSLFEKDPIYTWNSNPHVSKIIISNEYSTNERLIEKYPRIVVHRGDVGAQNIVLDRKGSTDKFFDPDTKHISDMAQGTVSIIVLSKNAIEAEALSDKIFQSILAFRHQFSKFIFKFTDIRVGTISVNQADSDVRIYSMTVNLGYAKEINFFSTFKYYDVELVVDGQLQQQHSDFYVYQNQIYFYQPIASGASIYMTYKIRETEQLVVNEAPIETPNGIIKIFTFSNNIYAPYYIVEGFDFEFINSGLSTFYTLPQSGDVGITQEGGPVIYRIGHTYSLPGNITTFTTPDTYINPFFISVTAGQTIKLVKARHQLKSGGSLTCNLLRNDQIISVYSGLLVNTNIGESDPGDIILNNNDSIRLEITSITGSPQNLTFTIFLEYIQ